ncbi:MAG: transporter ATP-binding protein [Acidimicrobiales bacterium]|nr:transporter ATP-binding protein [Acidimicrobiales bacterium]
MFEVRGLSAGYGTGADVIGGVTIDVSPGEVTCILGLNGAGKTTMLNALSGLVARASGEIELDGARLDGLTPVERVRNGLVHIPEGRHIFRRLSVDDNLRVCLGRSGRKDREPIERVYAHFPALAEKRRRAAGGLSGGQQQMLAIGRGLVLSPKVLLLDEPSVGLSPILVAETAEKIAELAATLHIPVLLVEQNLDMALKVSRRAFVLRRELVGPLEGDDLADRDHIQALYFGGGSAADPDRIDASS